MPSVSHHHVLVVERREFQIKIVHAKSSELSQAYSFTPDEGHDIALLAFSAVGTRRPEASPIPTTKLKQPALHWAQVVSVLT